MLKFGVNPLTDSQTQLYAPKDIRKKAKMRHKEEKIARENYQLFNQHNFKN